MPVRTVARFAPVIATVLTGAAGFGAEGPTGQGSQASDLQDALLHGTPLLMARYRYEHVDQHGFQDQAQASTLRLSLGYQTRPYAGVSAVAQFQGVFGVGDALYDDQPGYQGDNRYPLVNDPAGSELEQAYVSYETPVGPTRAEAKIGRQEIILGNQRLIGTAGWRQLWQSFEAATVRVDREDTLHLTAGVIGAAYRVSGDEAINLGGTASSPLPSPNDGTQRMRSWFADADGRRQGFGSADLYAVVLDYALAQSKGNNSATIGARVQGPWRIATDWSIVYALEAARQTAFAGYQAAGIAHYVAWYYQAEIGARWKGITCKAGWSLLQGSSAGDKFNTPLDSPHAFNGWAEQFVATPNLGLDARSLTLSGQVPGLQGVTMALVYYQFSSQSGGYRYGDEGDALLEYSPAAMPPLQVGMQIGSFREDERHAVPASLGGGPVDATKASLYTSIQF